MYLHKTLSRGINLFNMLTVSISQYVYLTYTNFVNLYFFETLQNLKKKIKKIRNWIGEPVVQRARNKFVYKELFVPNGTFSLKQQWPSFTIISLL